MKDRENEKKNGNNKMSDNTKRDDGDSFNVNHVTILMLLFF